MGQATSPLDDYEECMVNSLLLSKRQHERCSLQCKRLDSPESLGGKWYLPHLCFNNITTTKAKRTVEAENERRGEES
jgi:hypothetical protein